MKPLSLDLREQEETRDELTEGLDVHQGIAVPRHMSRPGQDGWRTPTIHDYEREKMERAEEEEQSTSDGPSASKEPANTPPTSAKLKLQSVVNLSKIDLSLERLHWRERIRHYTWTFFTMTMATGGIANVLYTVPFRFPGLYAIGAIFFFFNILLFVINVTLSPDASMDIIIGGFTLQGIGFLVAFMIYASYIYRLMTQKLPQASARPGMFVSVGPSGFTVAGVIGMADSIARNVDAEFMGDGKLASMILTVVANWTCLWIWGLAFWFFFVSVGAHWSCARQNGGFGFNMTWFSFVFPNTALITATFAVGKAFRSKAIQVIGCVMTVCLIIAWFWVFGMMIYAIKHRQILWPQKGEDKDEGGFKAPEMSERRHTLSKWVSGTSSKSNKQ
ncbi:MAG: hypothetical protein Q9218_002393 [Villophora microphyllina]